MPRFATPDSTENTGPQSTAKVVLIGDHHQLPAIDAGGAFRALVKRVRGVVELRENRRQLEAWHRQTLDDYRDGRRELAIAAFEQRGHITFADDISALRDANLGTAAAVRAERAQVLNAAYAAHPERFVNKAPVPPPHEPPPSFGGWPRPTRPTRRQDAETERRRRGLDA